MTPLRLGAGPVLYPNVNFITHCLATVDGHRTSATRLDHYHIPVCSSLSTLTWGLKLFPWPPPMTMIEHKMRDFPQPQTGVFLSL